MQLKEVIPDISVSITPLSGSGADKTTVVIDCSQRAAYWSVPFVSGGTGLVSTATANTQAYRIRDPALYSDSACTQLVGYYRVNTGAIASSRRTTASSPTYKFDVENCICPKGYYAKMVICRYGSNAFSSNDNFANYIKKYASTALLRA